MAITQSRRCHKWGHTFADKLGKLDSRNLREQAFLLTESTVHLASEDVTVEHKSPEEIANYLEDEDLAEGMQIIGDWPY